MILLGDWSWFLELQSAIKFGIEAGLLFADGTIYRIISIFLGCEFLGAVDTNLVVAAEVEQILGYLVAMETSFGMVLHTLNVIIKFLHANSE